MKNQSLIRRFPTQAVPDGMGGLSCFGLLWLLVSFLATFFLAGSQKIPASLKRNIFKYKKNFKKIFANPLVDFFRNKNEIENCLETQV